MESLRDSFFVVLYCTGSNQDGSGDASFVGVVVTSIKRGVVWYCFETRRAHKRVGLRWPVAPSFPLVSSAAVEFNALGPTHALRFNHNHHVMYTTLFSVALFASVAVSGALADFKFNAPSQLVQV